MNDCDIGPAVMWVESANRSAWSVVEGASPTLRSLWQKFDSLVVQDSVLYMLFYNAPGLMNHAELILPSELKLPFSELIHADAAGHLKYQKCVPRVRRQAWWLTWKRDLKPFIKCCQM